MGLGIHFDPWLMWLVTKIVPARHEWINLISCSWFVLSYLWSLISVPQNLSESEPHEIRYSRWPVLWTNFLGIVVCDSRRVFRIKMCILDHYCCCTFVFFAVFVLCPLGSASCCDIGWFGFCVEFVFVGNLLGQVILWCCWRKILLHPISSRGCCSQRLVYWRTRALKPKFSNIAEFRIRTRDQLLSLLRKARSLKPESFPRVK